MGKMFVGLDPSYNGFGIIVLDGKGEIVDQKLLTTTSKEEIEQRILNLEAEFKFIPSIAGLETVYLEGPAYSSNGQFILQMGALHYYIRIFLFRKNVNFKVIAPGTLKKFVAGDGRAKKELMLLKVYKKWGVEFEDNNLADAYGLARMALEVHQNEQNKQIPKQT